MTKDSRTPEGKLAGIEARRATMGAEQEKLGLPNADFGNSDDLGIYDGYPEIVRVACTAPLATLAARIGTLLDQGADPDAASPYGETAAATVFSRGSLDAFRLLLRRGADITQFGWSGLHLEIARGEPVQITPDDPRLAARDPHGRTPFLLALRLGALDVARSLGPVTPKEGRLTTPGAEGPLHMAARSGDMETLEWALASGADVNARDRNGCTALLTLVENDNLAGARVLLEAGADPSIGENISLASRRRDKAGPQAQGLAAKVAEAIANVASMPDDLPDTIVTPAAASRSPGMTRLLVEHGAPVGDFEAEDFPCAVGADWIAPATVTPAMFRVQCSPRRGTTNPERVDIPFWREQIRTGRSGYAGATGVLGQYDFDLAPVWSFQRFGRTSTRLPDGRWVLVAGEHEDTYDSDFCIYADVTVIGPAGGLAHYIYPEEVFPPTDFHTATLLGDHILLIGSLGYRGRRSAGVTQVLRLELADFSIRPVATRGDAPGWIHRHNARLEDTRILVSGGRIEPGYQENAETFALDLRDFRWHRLPVV